MSFNWLVFGDVYWMFKSFYKILCLKTQLMAPFLIINAVALIFCDPVQRRSYIFKCDLSGLVLFEAIVALFLLVVKHQEKVLQRSFGDGHLSLSFSPQGAPVRQINNHFLTTDTLSALTFSKAPSVKRSVLFLLMKENWTNQKQLSKCTQLNV